MRRLALALCWLALCSPVLGEDWAAHYAKRVAEFQAENAALDASRRHVVLVGDSLTEGWRWSRRVQRFLPALADRVLNRGISSDGVGMGAARGLKRRLDTSIFDCRPGHVVLLLGVNDVGRDGRGVAPAARVYEELVREVRARLPQVPLTLVTLAPARGGYATLNPHVLAFNEHVRRIAGETGCSLLDLHPLLADEGGALKERMATKDGLHWTDAAYEVLGREVERVVAEAGRPARRR